MSLFSQNEFRIKNPAALGVGCGKCRLNQQCDHPKMEPWGEGKAGLMFITGHPDAEDDDRGVLYSGARGDLLKHSLRKLGFNAERDSVIVSAVGCKPHGLPTGIHVNHCRSRLWKFIEAYRPKVIGTLSPTAMDSLIGHRWPKKRDSKDKGAGYQRFMGFRIPDRLTKSWIIPMYSPTQVLSDRANIAAIQVLFTRQLKDCIRYLNKPFPDYKDEAECAEVIEDENRAIQLLRWVLRDKLWVTIDYETTGVKPYRDTQKVYYVGVSHDDNAAFCFPATMQRAMRLFKNILTDPDIGKVAHNMYFEDLWSREKIGVQVRGWLMDTQVAVHIENQASGITGLKFQSYAQLGLIDYSSHISPYLEEALNEKEQHMGANKINRISLAPPKEVMKYCAIDCLQTRRLSRIVAHDMGVVLP